MKTCISLINLAYYSYKEKIQDLSNSKLGQWCKNAAIENVAEFVGWTAGSELGKYVGTEIGPMVFNEALTATTLLASPLIGYYASSAILNKLSITNSGKSNILTAMGTLATTTALVCFLPAALSDITASVGASIGSSVLSTSLGIVGGYAAIKLLGSDEILLDRNNLTKTYTIKSGLTIIGDKLIGLDSGYQLADFLINQIIGTATFHSLEAIELAGDIKDHKALDDLLPMNPKNLGLFNDTFVNLLDEAQAIRIFDNFNEYLQLIKGDNDCKNMMDNFNQLHVQLKNISDQSKREEINDEIIKLKTELDLKVKDIIEKSIDRSIINNILNNSSPELIDRIKENNEIQSLIVNMGLDIEFDKNNLVRITIDSLKINELANAIDEGINKLEKETIGVSLGGLAEKAFLRNYLQTHLPNLLTYSLLKNLVMSYKMIDKIDDVSFDISKIIDKYNNLSKINHQETSTDFYKNLLGLIAPYLEVTSGGIGKHALKKVFENLEKQVEHGKRILSSRMV